MFITGGSGFVGTHLVDYALTLDKYNIFATVFGEGDNALTGKIPAENCLQLNLLDAQNTSEVVARVKPDYVVHLAALSSASDSFSQPAETLQNNIVAEVNLLESLRKLEKLPTTLIIGSAEEYGVVEPHESPVTETNPLRPLSPYAVSKISQDYLGLQYFLTYKIPVIRLRPFNHTGERHIPKFVLPAFAKQIAEIEAGLIDHMMVVGDLSVVRDFTDVKDMVIAYELALNHCVPGEVYNIGSGRGTKIEVLLDLLLKLTTAKVEVKKDPSKFRPADVKVLVCNADKFKQATNWQPTVGLENTVERVLNYWRENIRKSTHV